MSKRIYMKKQMVHRWTYEKSASVTEISTHIFIGYYSILLVLFKSNLHKQIWTSCSIISI